MRICSKCNKDVTPGQLYCPRCGFSLIKNKYGERLGAGGNTSKILTPEAAQKINASNMEHTNKMIQAKRKTGNNNTVKTEPKIATIAVIIFIISSFIPILITIFSSVRTTDSSLTITNKYNIDSVIQQVTVLATDNFNVRNYYAENSYIDLAIIAEETNLEGSDLTPSWCTWLESNNT